MSSDFTVEAIYYFFMVISFYLFSKPEKDKLLIGNFVFCIATAFYYYYYQSFTASWMHVLIALYVTTIFYLDKKDIVIRALPKFTAVLTFITVVSYFTYSVPLDAIPILSAIIMRFGEINKNVNTVRSSYLVGTSLYIFYCQYLGLTAGMISSAVCLLFIAYPYAKSIYGHYKAKRVYIRTNPKY
ncbi:MAG: hypothetical protein CMP22_03855 [Rickettsiales bacterium]|nr:hypothetical protein [Rickettsiales bacterium]|tara:strand:+ start:1164 stop:1718 length:555 start_codon:yes stop_codon:yes gene_type:complete